MITTVNKASYEKKRLKFSKDQKKLLTLHNEIHNEMYCIMNFLSFSVATSEKHNFISISKSLFLVFPQHMSCKALL